MVSAKLCHSIKSERCILFAGAGLSRSAGCPDWNDLRKVIINDLVNGKGFDPVEISAVTNEQIFELYSSIFSTDRLHMLLQSRLSSCCCAPSEVHQLITEIPFHVVLTTNWDDLIERAFEANGFDPCVVIKESDLPKIDYLRPIIVKLHGDISKPSTLIATESDYISFHNRNPRLWEWVSAKMTEKDVLFWGYSLRDFHLKLLPAFSGRRESHGKLFITCFESTRSNTALYRARGLTTIRVHRRQGESSETATIKFAREMWEQTRLYAHSPTDNLKLLLRENEIFMCNFRKHKTRQPRIRCHSNMAVFGSPLSIAGSPLFCGKKTYHIEGHQIDFLERKLFNYWMFMISEGVEIDVIISLLFATYTKYNLEQIERRLDHLQTLLEGELSRCPHVRFAVKNATIERKITVFGSSSLVIIEHAITPVPTRATTTVSLDSKRIERAIAAFDEEFKETCELNRNEAHMMGLEEESDVALINKYIVIKIDELRNMCRQAAQEGHGGRNDTV